MMKDLDIQLRREPVAATSATANEDFYAKMYRHPRCELEAPPISNHEVVLVLEGSGTASRTLGDGRKQAFRFRPGLLAITPAGETQRLSLSAESLAIHFYVAPIRLLSVGSRKFDPVPAFGAKDDTLSSLGRLLSIEMTTGLPSGRLFKEHLEGAVLERLPLGLTQLEKLACHRERLAPWQLRRAKELIRDDIRKDWSLRELAADVGASPSHFCRAFRNEEGIPPYRYLTSLRIERVKRLLNESSMPLSEIAEEVGCETVGQLSRLFRRETGTSPTAYRRQLACLRS